MQNTQKRDWNRGGGDFWFPILKNVLFLANIERCPKFLKYAMKVDFYISTLLMNILKIMQEGEHSTVTKIDITETPLPTMKTPWATAVKMLPRFQHDNMNTTVVAWCDIYKVRQERRRVTTLQSY